MQKERLFIYDTTLRDGQQTQGVQFSLNEKLSVIRSLDDLGAAPNGERLPSAKIF